MKPARLFQLFTGLVTLEGLWGLVQYFGSPSKTNQLLVGQYSASRLLLGLGLAALWLFFAGIFLIAGLKSAWLSLWGARIKRWLASDLSYCLIAPVFFLFLGLNLLSLAVTWLPITNWLAPFIRTAALIRVVGERLAWAQLWAVLILLKSLFFYYLFGRNGESNLPLSTLRQAALAGWSGTLTLLVISLGWGWISRDLNLQLEHGPLFKVLGLTLWFSLWALAERFWPTRFQRFSKFLVLGTLWLVVFLSAWQLADWLHTVTTTRESYWHLLADSFLHGRLDLPDPPSDQDLVLFQGNWYVPMPPMPAILLIPLVALFGASGINLTLVSLCLAATTACLLFLIFQTLQNLGWIQLSTNGQLWLVALFAFGTVHLWLSVVSRVWYFSQVCAVFLAALAFFLALKQAPAWTIGLSLGLGLMARPNLFTLWPALAALALQLQIDAEGRFSWRKLWNWAWASSLPVVAAVGFLLLYNYLRFGNLLDFGYTSIVSGGTVVSDAQQYGVFSLHFIPINLQTMFLALPELDVQCHFFLPRGHGISMLAATPALVYLFRRFKFSWWTAGCWLSLLLSLALLSTYHNDGSIQYAYRYLMDFILPVMLLLALKTGEEVSWLLKLLILVSIGINYYGTISWFFSKC